MARVQSMGFAVTEAQIEEVMQEIGEDEEQIVNTLVERMFSDGSAGSFL